MRACGAIGSRSGSRPRTFRSRRANTRVFRRPFARGVFDADGTGGIGAGFRSMNFVVEDCGFTNIGKKIDWGKYDSPDPATTKMMVCFLLFVCLLINWLCVVIRRCEILIMNTKIRIDRGRVLMAITSTLMMVQAGYPTGICVVRSRSDNHRKGRS